MQFNKNRICKRNNHFETFVGKLEKTLVQSKVQQTFWNKKHSVITSNSEIYRNKKFDR